MDVIIDGVVYQNQYHGGISRIFDEILPRICNQDNNLSIKLFTSGRCKKILPNHKNIHHISLFPIDDILRPKRIWRNSRFGIRSIFQYLSIKGGKGKIWHSTHFTQPYNWKGEIVLNVYDLIYERFGNEYFNKPIYVDFRKHIRKCINDADIVICISETTKKDLEKYYSVDPNKIEVIHLASSSIFHIIGKNYYIPTFLESKPFLLFVGARYTYKNFNNFLRAYSVWDRNHDFDIVVVGNSWTKQEISLFNELGIDTQIHLLSNIDDDKLCILYNKASALIYPSLYEGFGIPILEAMACGCPIVASNIPSTKEIADNIPYYFEPTDLDSIINAFDKCMSKVPDPERVRLGISRSDDFSWDITAKKTLSIYNKLLNNV